MERKFNLAVSQGKPEGENLFHLFAASPILMSSLRNAAGRDGKGTFEGFFANGFDLTGFSCTRNRSQESSGAAAAFLAAKKREVDSRKQHEEDELKLQARIAEKIKREILTESHTIDEPLRARPPCGENASASLLQNDGIYSTLACMHSCEKGDIHTKVNRYSSKRITRNGNVRKKERKAVKKSKKSKH
jgi:hypothetical protein